MTSRVSPSVLRRSRDGRDALRAAASDEGLISSESNKNAVDGSGLVWTDFRSDYDLVARCRQVRSAFASAIGILDRINDNLNAIERVENDEALRDKSTELRGLERKLQDLYAAFDLVYPPALDLPDHTVFYKWDMYNFSSVGGNRLDEPLKGLEPADVGSAEAEITKIVLPGYVWVKGAGGFRPGINAVAQFEKNDQSELNSPFVYLTVNLQRQVSPIWECLGGNGRAEIHVRVQTTRYCPREGLNGRCQPDRIDRELIFISGSQGTPYDDAPDFTFFEKLEYLFESLTRSL